MSWIDDKAQAGLTLVREVQKLNLYPHFRPFESGGLHTSVDGKPIVNFSSNDYLGLTKHPKVKEAAKARGRSLRVRALVLARAGDDHRARRARGAARALVRLRELPAVHDRLSGDGRHDPGARRPRHARWSSTTCPTPASSTAPSSRPACPAQAPEVRYFNHNSARSLERCLKTKERKNALVLMEGIYSLDGDRAPLPEFVEVCERYDAVLLCDDAHGTGTLGERGTGILEETGMLGPRAGRDQHVLEDLRRHRRDPARQHATWSTSSSTTRARSASARRCRCRSSPRRATILDMLEEDGPGAGRRSCTRSPPTCARACSQLGFDLGKSNTHIMPVMCRDERKALFMHVALLEQGVMMVPITYPGVKQGEERLRLNVTRGHTREDMDRALDLLDRYGKQYKRPVGRRAGAGRVAPAARGRSVVRQSAGRRSRGADP